MKTSIAASRAAVAPGRVGLRERLRVVGLWWAHVACAASAACGSPPAEVAIADGVAPSPGGGGTPAPGRESTSAPGTPASAPTTKGGDLPATPPPAGSPDDAPACAPIAAGAGVDIAATTELTLTHDGRARTYVVHVGAAVRAGAPAPLVVNIHGFANSPEIQEGFSNMNGLADREGFVVASPRGVGASFNAGTCCGEARSSAVDDVGFIRRVVADVASRTCIDRARVYATGFSNGGFMAHRLACEASDTFAAIGVVAGASGLATCTPARPIPVIDFHGTIDTVVTYADGQKLVNEWRVTDGCGASTRTAFGASYCLAYDGCRGGARVHACTIAGGWHLWPGAGADVEASPAIWAFFKQFALPSLTKAAK